MSNSLIVLFKSFEGAAVSENDELSLLLNSRGIDSKIISPLVFNRIEGSALREALERIYKSRIDGLHSVIVVTSPRAAQILADALINYKVEVSVVVDIIFYIFTSGSRTACIIRDAIKGQEHFIKVISPSEDEEKEGRHSNGGGGSGAMIPLLRQFFCGKEQKGIVLFIRGDRALRAIPEALLQDGITINEVIVYESAYAVPSEIQSAWYSSIQYGVIKRSPSILVFYSPSGFEAILAANCDDLNAILCKKGDKQTIPIIAIGATTAAAIESRGYIVTGIADSPDPSSLFDIILRFIQVT